MSDATVFAVSEKAGLDVVFIGPVWFFCYMDGCPVSHRKMT
jgi:hypothetical protein